MKTQKITTFFLVATLLAGCTNTVSSSSNDFETYSNYSLNDVFDTSFAYRETSTDTQQSTAHFEQAETLLAEYSDLYDIYNSFDAFNNLKTINDNAGIAPVEVDQRIIDLLQNAKKFYEYSNGEFDITIGSVLKVWHTYREEGMTLNQAGELGKIPSQEELEAASQYTGWEYIEIDDENNTVYITDSNVSLDVGGIAKGYATEEVALVLENDGMSSGFLNVGRNIRFIGTKVDGSPWSIGIADPNGSQEYASGLVILSYDEPISVVTSGDYERYYIGEDGNQYSHIIDPDTLFPSTLYRSVTILTEDSGAADCLSTTLFTLSVEEGKQVLEAYTKDTGKSAEAVWIMNPDQTQSQQGVTINNLFVTYTEGLEDKFVWNS